MLQNLIILTTFDGGGKSLMAATMAGTGMDPELEMCWPKNSSLGTANTNLLVLRTIPNFLSRSNRSLMCLRCFFIDSKATKMSSR